MPPSNPMRDVCIAVVGAYGVGKSTFIQRAYDLKSPSSKDIVFSKFTVVDRPPCNVKLAEIDWAKIDFESQPFVWPRVGFPIRFSSANCTYGLTHKSHLKSVFADGKVRCQRMARDYRLLTVYLSYMM